jgi:hypothetical protein
MRSPRNGIPSLPRFGYDRGIATEWAMKRAMKRAMKWMLAVGGLFALACMASPVMAGDAAPVDGSCYWCARDGIYANVALINHLEANPDIDDSIKGPQIFSARADVHRLRALLGPLNVEGPEPCCYARKPMFIR